MRNRFDYGAKQIGDAALRPFGRVVANAEINAETQYADLRYEPDPARDVERAGRLGLLGRFAAHACLIEVYSDAPGPGEFRACLAKHLAFWQQRTRDARRGEQAQPSEDVVAPFLWILAAGVPTTLLAALNPASSPDWPKGVYFFCPDVLRVGIVAASELPRDPTTLLVRIMAAGPLLAPAVTEVAKLPPTDLARVIAEPVLLQLQQVLGQKPNPDPDEKEFIMAMIKSWEEGRAEARAEGRQEGRQEGFREMLLHLLRQRFSSEVDAHVERRVAAASVKQVETWTSRVLSAATLAELLAD